MMIIKLQYHFCRITILIRSLLLLRKCWLDWGPTSFEDEGFQRFRESACASSGKWVAQFTRAGEALLIEALGLRRPTYGSRQPWSGDSTVSPPPPLAFAPDHMCWMVMFAPMMQIKTNLIYMSVLDRPVPSAQARRGLLSKMLDTLREAVPIWAGDKSQENGSNGENVLEAPSTLPARCVDALTSLIKLWDVRTEECKVRETQKAANKSNAQAGDIPMKEADATGTGARSGKLLDHPDDERDELESDTEDMLSRHTKASGDPTAAHIEPQSLNINDSGKPSQQRTSSTSSTAVPNDTPSMTTTLEPWDPTSLSSLDLSVFENAPSFLDTQMLLDPNFAFVLDPQYTGQNTSSFVY